MATPIATEIAGLRVASPLHDGLTMMTIEIDELEHVTGGRGKVSTAMKVAKTAMKWGGKALEVADTIGTVVEGAQFVKQGYDWMRGKKDPAADQ